MKPPYPLFFLLAFCLSCFGCHSSKRIIIENKTKEEAEITFVLNPDSLHQSRLYILNSDTVRFVMNHTKHRKIKMSFGSGNWRPKSLTAFADDLQYLQLKWNKDFIKLDSTQGIIDFLSARRKGMDKSQVRIILE